MNYRKMHNYRVITSTNESQLYIHFWPTMAINWKWYGVEKISCAFITNRGYDDPLVKKMQEYGEIILFKPLEGIEDSVQAKATRIYLATQYDDYCIIGDVDMYILNREETWTKWFSNVREDKLLCISANLGGPYRGTDQGKFPMAYTTAKGKVWQELINPNKLEYEKLFQSWFNIKLYDTMEAINNPFHRFSDESLLRALVSKWENFDNRQACKHPRCVNVERDDWRGWAQRRIDRANWFINVERLNSGYYYDSQPLRPFNDNYLLPILEYLKIDKKDWFLK